MKSELERATSEQSDAIARVHRLTRETSMPYLVRRHTREEDRRFFKERVFSDCEVWVAKSDSNIIGFCALRTGWVDHLYVCPMRQRSGIGSALLEKAMENNEELRLWVFQRNVTAIRFYRSKGFRIVKTTDGLGNEEREPDALYARSSRARAF